jgi:hypothetical protein
MINTIFWLIIYTSISIFCFKSFSKTFDHTYESKNEMVMTPIILCIVSLILGSLCAVFGVILLVSLFL